MRKFAFISRHAATPEQLTMALEKGIELVQVGDMNAFLVSPEHIVTFGCQDYSIDGVIVVHPAAALRLNHFFDVGVFENGQRSEDGGRLTFYPVALHVYPKTGG